MKMLTRRVLWLLLPALLWQPLVSAAAVSKIPVLQTMTASYTNVTVMSKTTNEVWISHSSGMCNLKLDELTTESRQLLGFGGSAATPEGKSGGSSGAESDGKSKVSEYLKNLGTSLSAIPGKISALSEPIGAKMKEFNIDRNAAFILLGGAFVAYLFLSFCLRLICVKADSSPGFLIWIPVLQMIPLLRAASMSTWWFVVWLLPGLNLIAYLLWSLNICLARGKSMWVALLLLLPGLNILALLYLAFSPKYRGRQTADTSTTMVAEAA